MGLGLGWEGWTLRPHLGLGPLAWCISDADCQYDCKTRVTSDRIAGDVKGYTKRDRSKGCMEWRSWVHIAMRGIMRLKTCSNR